MAGSGDREPDDTPTPTRWNIRREIGGSADFGSAKGRHYSVGDTLNIPPPLPRGSTWRVVAVEPPETDGYDGTLVLEPAEGNPLAAGQ